MRNLSIAILVCVIALFTSCHRHKDTMSVLYQQLDQSISDSARIMALQKSRISLLRRRWSKARQPEQRYIYADSLYQVYASYINDSAVVWAIRCYNLSKNLEDSELSKRSTLNLVYQYAKSGYYTEAVTYFSQINPACLSPDMQTRYYDVGSDLYGNFGYSTEDPTMKKYYWQISKNFRDSAYRLMPKHSMIYLRNRVQQLVNDNRGYEALSYSNRWMALTKPNTHEYAIMAYYRSEAYHKMGNVAKQKEWLARSAVADLNNAVMDQASLWMLADILYSEGQLDRAYRYMAYSWKCVSLFTTHKRAWDVTPILTVINESYQQKTRTANQRLTVLCIVVILLFVISVTLLVYVQHKRHQLGEARNSLDRINRQLLTTIEQLHRVNADLKESDRVKDKYIGNFFSLYSSCIEKLDNFRAKVRRKLKAGQREELLALTDPDNMYAEAHKEFMENFDNIFLSLYPTFVDDFNALLRPDCHIRPVGKERMNTTLRIFALIRLGITESARIAEILGYSPNSIYNYRTRAKNMSAGPRESFEERIRHPGNMNIEET